MKTFVVNAGSSSIKFQLFNGEECLVQGMCEAIGLDFGKIILKFDGKKVDEEAVMKDHKAALELLIKKLEEHKFDISDCGVVAHRTVHGGELFRETTLITDEIVAKLKELIPLAPLHNPANILCIEILSDLLPGAKQVAVFDTAFHSSLPQQAYLYGIPYAMYKKHGIRKYGFHGSSHKYVINEALKKLGNPDAKVINCHLGNGASICACVGGKSMDTSMGFTPMQGSVMGTRCGLIDPSIVTFLMEAEDLSVDGINTLLNKESGLLGLSEISSDFRRICEARDNGDEAAIRAFNVMAYRLVKLVGGYVAALNGVDAITFTGGIGENAGELREWILNHFTYLGLELDVAANNSRGDATISTANSKVKSFVIETNEELQMVREAKALLGLE